MKKFLKISAIISIIGMFLFISAIMGIYFFVDPNDYKDKIAGEVQKATGREFSVRGKIALSVFPLLELKVGAMELKNPPEFEEKIMAKIEDAELGLKLMPLLLRRELEMKKIILSGLDIHLIKNQDGKTNWDDLAKRFSSKEEKPDSEQNQVSENMLDKLDIAGVKLNNLRGVFDDREKGVSYQISDLNLDSGKLKIGKPLDIDLNFNLASAKPEINANFDLKTVVNLLLNDQLVKLDKTRFAIVLNKYHADNQAKSLSGNLNLSSDLAVNWGSGDLKAENFNLKTDVKGIQQLPNSEADADLKASLLSFNWKKPALEITGLDLSDNKNNHKIKGNVSILDIQQNPKIRFDLTGNEIDINRYLSASSEKQTQGKEESSSFKNPDINGTLKLAKIKIQDIHLSDLFMNIASHSGKNENTGDLNLRFNIVSSKPEIKANIDLKTVMTLLSEKQTVKLDNTKLTLLQVNLVPKKGEAAITGNLDLSGNLFVNWNEGRFKADNLNLKSDLKGGAIPGGGTDLKISGNTDLNWKKETLNLSNMDVNAYDLHITGESNADTLFSDPQIKAALNIAEFSPKKLMQILKIETKDLKGLDKASGSFSLTTGKNRTNLSDLKIKIDNTNLYGNAEFAVSAIKEIRFDLNADEININSYLSENDKKSSSKTDKKSDTSKETLRSLVLDGKVAVNKLKIKKINLQDALVKITAKDGVFNIDPFSTILYGGKYNSNIKADFRKEMPLSSFNGNLSGLQLGNLLKGIIGEDKVTGTGNINLDLSGIGDDWNLLRKNLNGEGAFSLKNGIFHGFQIIPDIVRKQAIELDPKKRMEKISKQQEFKDFNGKVNIRNGLVRSDNLTLTGDHFQITAKGICDLAKGEIDYDIQANIEGIPIIPYKIKGPFSNITASLDTVEFAKNIAIGTVKLPLNVGTGVLDIGTDALDKGKKLIGEGDGVKNIGTGVLDVGKGVLNIGKGVLNVGKGAVDTEKRGENVKEGVNNAGDGVKDIGKGLTDVGKGTVEAIGSGIKSIFGGDQKEKDKNQ